MLLALLWASPPSPAAATAFDARANPWQYAGEYRDPTWGGAYLRQRWYDPRLPAFVSRDPAAAQVNHYGYGGGDPLMHVDPSGRRYRGAVGRPLAKGLGRIEGGVGGHFARFFLSPFLSPLQIVADPGSFWSAVAHDRRGMTVMLAAGVVAEVGTSGFWGLPKMSFARHLLLDQVFGFGQATAAAAGRHFNRDAFAAALEYHFGAESWTRLLLGFGYRPFTLNLEDADLAAHTLGEGEADIYRVRYPVGSRRSPNTSPIGELTRTAYYHEAIIAVTRDEVLVTEYGSAGAESACVRFGSYADRSPSAALAIHDVTKFGQLRGPPQLRFVARIPFDPDEDDYAFYNPRGRKSSGDVRRERWGYPAARYSRWRVFDNSHWHARAVLADLGIR